MKTLHTCTRMPNNNKKMIGLDVRGAENNCAAKSSKPTGGATKASWV